MIGFITLIITKKSIKQSNKKLLNFIFKFQNLTVQMRPFLESDTSSHDWPFDSTRPAQDCLGRYKTVLNVFFLATGWECHDDFERVAVCGKNEDFNLAFGDFFEYFVDAFPDLFEGKKLLYEFTDFFGELRISKRLRFEDFLLDGVFVFGFFFCSFEQVNELLFLFAHEVYDKLKR